jgi:short subunit dehydrogenase-like uncharacterized protein
VGGESDGAIMTNRRSRTVAVFGAYGHTGRFVAAELRRRGIAAILSGRDRVKLDLLGPVHPDSDLRVASIEDPTSLDRALDGADVIINCAGPFGETAPALIEAALRAHCHYLDVTGEALVTIETFARYADSELNVKRVRDADIVLVPSMAFYGALGDLLATVALGDWAEADDISIAVALDSWKPTRGTRLASERRAGRRVVYRNRQIEILSAETQSPMATWNFPPPFGFQEMVGEFPTVDVVTISRHLVTPKISAYLNTPPIKDLRDPNTTGPQPADASGRSSQIFLVEVVARRGNQKRSTIARGRDIYAITAPIVVEAAARILNGNFKRKGIGAPAEIFDARDFLDTLAPEHLTIEIP